MDKIGVLLLTVVAGFGLSSQAAINGTLGKSTGAVEASLISFFIGTIGLVLAVLFLGKGNLAAVFTVPKWQLFGGLIGAVYVLVLTIAAPRIGVGMAVISVICGQMLMSMVIDNFGWLHTKPIPINGYRVAGVLLLFVALGLIYVGSNQTASAQKDAGKKPVSTTEK
jgi:transporter family-2 protein